jgi:hypothetical protein
MVLTVLSALARCGVDPWGEAARLNEFPRDAPAKRLHDDFATASRATGAVGNGGQSV